MRFLYFVILVFRKVGKKCFPMLNVFFWVFFFGFWHSSTINKLKKALIQSTLGVHQGCNVSFHGELLLVVTLKK